jgi:SagB-type dehydrogenase family enzyme
MNEIGDNFQKQTKFQRDKMSGKGLDWSVKPELYKEYPESHIIELPEVHPLTDTSLYEAIKNRKSIRSFKNKEISKEILSYLLWSSTGISRKKQDFEFRTAPSAGALYPIETYLLINNVEDVKPGIYHYSNKNHNLELLKEGDYAVEIAEAALGQKMCADSSVVFIWTAIFQRMKWKYRQRAYRYIYLDAGHIAENLALSATSLELGSCQLGALYDDELNEIIGVDGTDESVIYMSAVG